MSDPSLLLQGAIVAALKADATLKAIVVDRVYDAVPGSPTFPYVTVGDGTSNGDDIDCAEISEIFYQIHGWSRAVGYPEVKNISSAIRTVMRTPLTISGYTINVTEYQQTQWLRDPDGLTRHSMSEFRFIITH